MTRKPDEDILTERIVQEKIKSMREEEIVDFIRTDVIPNLNSLADRLESYIDAGEAEFEEKGHQGE